MKYGIEQNDKLVLKCANCEKIVAEDGELKKNYCSRCGAPLSLSAIADFEELKENMINNVLEALQNIADENKTDSLKQVLEIYKED